MLSKLTVPYSRNIVSSLIIFGSVFIHSAYATSAPPEPGQYLPANLDGFDGSVIDSNLAEITQEYAQMYARRYHSVLEDVPFDPLHIYVPSKQKLEKWQKKLRHLEQQLSLIHFGQLSSSDQYWYSGTQAAIEAQKQIDRCGIATWNLEGQFINWPSWQGGPTLFSQDATISTQDEAKFVLKKFKQVARLYSILGPEIAAAAAAGDYSTQERIEYLLGQLEPLIALPVKEWPQYTTPAAGLADTLSEAEQEAFLQTLYLILNDKLKPTYKRLVKVLKKIVPEARTNELPGLAYLSSGDACYRVQLLLSIGEETNPEALHELGWTLLEESHRNLVALGKQLFGINTLEELITHLRADTSLRYGSSAEIESFARDLLVSAEKAAPDFFEVVPQQSPTIETFDAPGGVGAFYNYVTKVMSINVANPEEEYRFALPSIVFHETIPGHHLDQTIQSERAQFSILLDFINIRQLAKLEGWALYAEGLGEDMGLYTDPLWLLGAYFADAQRAARIVIDTGINHYGWSRQQGYDLLKQSTFLSENIISSELSRYVYVPGTNTSYKLGETIILDFRRQAKELLGDNFSIKEFHTQVLGFGAEPMGHFRARMNAWLDQYR